MTREMSSIMHCPFCGATPHRGLTPKTIGQDGEPFQRYAIWCPHFCARIERVNESAAVADWNARPAALLGALKIAEDFMADFVGDRPEDAEKLAAVRAAISKATGEPR